jgi:hypothetical protein
MEGQDFSLFSKKVIYLAKGGVKSTEAPAFFSLQS